MIDFPNNLTLPQQTIFARGSLFRLPKETLCRGEKGMIIHSRALSDKAREIAGLFPDKENILLFARAEGEPTTAEVSSAIEQARKHGARWIAAIGGGGALDLGKAAAGLYNAVKEPDYYQSGGVLIETGIPFIAVPATAGTGSEASVNAVIINTAKNEKLSIRDNSFIARTVILDAGLLESLPADVMAHSAMDALVQAYESFVSRNSTWLSDSFSFKSVALLLDNILPGCLERRPESLEKMLLASYLGGIAFSSSRLGLVHGLAHPLGVLYGVPHGLVCASLFPHVIRFNKPKTIEKYKILCDAARGDFIEKAEIVTKALGIISPFAGKPLIEKEKIISETLKSGSTAANPITVARSDIENILENVFTRSLPE